MRIAALSDVHGNVFALRAVLAALADDRVDLVVVLGDHLSGAIEPAATAELLMDRPWVSVAGNHERQVLNTPPEQMGASDHLAYEQLTPRSREWLLSLPAVVKPANGVLAFHGTPRDDLEYLLHTVTPAGARPATPDEVRERLSGHVHHALLLCGHTHVAGAMRLDDPGRADGGPFVLNPGSVGWPAYRDDEPHPHVMEAGSPHARYAIADDVTGRWEAEFRAIEYDWDAAAAVARANGRPEVAHALLTGSTHASRASQPHPTPASAPTRTPGWSTDDCSRTDPRSPRRGRERLPA